MWSYRNTIAGDGGGVEDGGLPRHKSRTPRGSIRHLNSPRHPATFFVYRTTISLPVCTNKLLGYCWWKMV